jgi:hypothetical protein
MEPYVVRENDYLAKIAFKFGFDADSVWNDPSNDDLRTLRPNPNLLFPGDVLYIPDQDDPPVTHSLVTGSTNAFTAPDSPTVTVTQTFVGADSSVYASRAFAVTELEDLTGLTTDGDGTATFPVPVSLDRVTIVFTDSGESWQLLMGGMDPIGTLSGMFKRLQNLNYLGGNVLYNSDAPSANVPVIRAGLRLLKAAQGQAGGASTAGDSSPDSSSSDSNPDPSSGDDSGDPAPADDAGLDDEGHLDDDTRALLVKAYGC